jgi:hypothetical protein
MPVPSFDIKLPKLDVAGSSPVARSLLVRVYDDRESRFLARSGFWSGFGMVKTKTKPAL